MKKLAKAVVAKILGYQVRRLAKNNSYKVIGIVGSIGKTSTKLAIANVLKAGLRVRYQEGNYNDIVSVPLVFFGQEIPSLFNPLAWLAVFWNNQKQTGRGYPYDVVVVELGSDGPGQISRFKDYLKLEISVVTAITPEHMEYFKDLDEVAREELAVSKISSLVLANKDLCDGKYLAGQDNLLTYAIEDQADYRLSVNKNELAVSIAGKSLLEMPAGQTKAEQYSVLAACAVAEKLGLTEKEIKQGISKIKPVPGRMQKLAGINGSTIIDDSYNSSPDAAKMALDSLYQLAAPQKIAVLGNMNELGSYSEQAHREIGEYCDPKHLDLVITIGPDANEFLAPAAESKGCRVERFDSPYLAGNFLKDNMKPKAAVLVKGSQNKVFAEEAIKSVLADGADISKLVRQSPAWLAKKQKMFGQ